MLLTKSTMFNTGSKLVQKFYSGKTSVVPKICIVGGGPAGFYAAQHLVKHVNNAEIDILERLPVPFGLVRYGVAPDHPEVKNVINTFTKTALNPRVRFIGNINLGKTITVPELQEAYHAVILTYGAENDRNLNIPGEELKNIISARSIVGWYNGVPWNSDLKIDLSGSTAVIVGQGNVAIDVARILLSPIDLLKKTDITQHALETLMSSKIREVHLVGRRGPLQAAFTIKELREMLRLPGCQTKWSQEDFTDIPSVLDKLSRPKKRLTELMLNSLKTEKKDVKKYFIPKFFRSPLKFSGIDKINKVTLGINTLIGDDLLNQSAKLTGKIEELDCDLVVRSIGYKSTNVDSTHIPFDENKGIIKNDSGRIDNGFYTAGWLATGPTGVILSTMNNSFELANNICKDIIENKVPLEGKPGFEKLKELIKKNNIRIVSWKGWEKIDEHEQAEGKKLGKPREKVISINKMLEIGGEYVS